MDGTFLTAEWRDLLMLNYSVDPNLLMKYVPIGTELDECDGKTFLSLVGFQFLKTRVFGISFPFHSNFEEVNLRFYVRCCQNGEVRRGVVFIGEMVPRRAIAMIANAFYNENYVALPMGHRISPENSATRCVEYSWKLASGEARMTAVISGAARVPENGSEQQFIAEHYWGYAAQGDSGTMEYRVGHPAWKVWSTEWADFEGDLTGLYGAELAEVVHGRPSSAFVAEGSEVTVHRGRRL